MAAVAVGFSRGGVGGWSRVVPRRGGGRCGGRDAGRCGDEASGGDFPRQRLLDDFLQLGQRLLVKRPGSAAA